MKHIRYLLLLLLTFPFCLTTSRLKAQEGRGYFYKNTDRVFYGGLVAGFNIPALKNDVYDGYHMIGFNGGAVVYGRMFRRLLGSVEFLYTMKGCRGVRTYDSYYSGTFVERYFVDLNYVEIPIVFHFLLNDKWSVGLGGAYAQLLKSKEDIVTDQPVYFDPLKYPFNKQEYSLVITGDMQLYHGWFVSLRYQQSLNYVRDLNYVPYGYATGPQKNQVYSLRLTYLIN
jgi:hypothetical protein